MSDRFYEDLEIALSTYSRYSIDEYDEEEEEIEGEYADEEFDDAEIEGKSDELACPFCSEDFDVLGLCCHIDADHRMEVKPGICPVCVTKVGVNMASHVITQHQSILRTFCNKKPRSTRSGSVINALRKDMQEKHLCHIKESPRVGSSSNMAADSKLLSFVNYKEPSNRPQIVEAASSSESSLSGKGSSSDSFERTQPSLTTDRKTEKARRCEFVQGLVFSTILDDL